MEVEVNWNAYTKRGDLDWLITSPQADPQPIHEWAGGETLAVVPIEFGSVEYMSDQVKAKGAQRIWIYNPPEYPSVMKLSP